MTKLTYLRPPNMVSYSLETLARVMKAEWSVCTQATRSVSYLMLDSRHLPFPGALFFAIKGEQHNGHQFLPDAYKAGVRDFVVSGEVDENSFLGSNILKVEDCLRALQEVAAFHRSQFHLPVVGITGSNGKTIVKEWLSKMVSDDFSVVKSPKSYNSQTGVPLSVWQIRPEHTLGIFEAGISKPGEMERLEQILLPSLGVFTMLGPAHREGFESDDQKLQEKMRLFSHCASLVFAADQPLIKRAADTWLREKPGRAAWSWSATGLPAMVQVKVNKSQPNGSTLHFAWKGQQIQAFLPFSDEASVENAIHSFVGGLALGVAPAVLAAEMARLEPVEMRMELKSGIEGSTLVNDFYNNDLASLRILMHFGLQQAQGRALTLILSDILQSGQVPEVLYREVALSIRGIRRLIGIGSEISSLARHLPESVEAHFFADTPSFLAAVHQFHWRNHLILLKGARPFAFERIAARLEQKAHQTRLEISLTALIHNLNVYRGLLSPGVKSMAMVKAAAYGSGSAEVGRLLEFHQVDYLGVAYADEGIELRNAGVQLPILVLNPESASFDLFHRYRLEPEVYSLELLGNLIGYTGTTKEISIHLKLDTGMHRLGFEEPDMAELCTILQLHPNLKVASVFSHLSASDNPVHDAFTHRQASSFQAMYDQISLALGYRPIRHLVNSSGIARFKEYHFEMVRLGIGLYGVDGSPIQAQLKVVNTLKTAVSQVKVVPVGDSVGYNRNSGVLLEEKQIATIRIGYADGFLRLAGGGRYQVRIGNQMVPTIGNICMDMTMIDITGLQEVRPGDEVVVFGDRPTVQNLASCLQTIPYEVFTNISDRVKRVYIQE